MTYLGSRQATGYSDTSGQNPFGSGYWTARFRVEELPPEDFEMFHAAVRGPGGYFLVYIDTAFYSTADRGDINEFDPQQAMYVRRGQELFFYWSVPSSQGSAPQVWIYLRTPEIGAFQ